MTSPIPTQNNVGYNLRGALERKERLLAVIQEIDAELTDKNKQEPGRRRRMSANDYHQWRARQVQLKKDKLIEYRLLKRWISDEQARLRAESLPIKTGDLQSLLRAAHQLLRHFAARLGWDNITPEQKLLIDTISDYVR